MKKKYNRILYMILFCFAFPSVISAQEFSEDSDSYYRQIIYLREEDNQRRFDLAPFVGEDYHELLALTDEVQVLSSDDNEIKIGNDSVSITARADGVITRVRLDEDDRSFCIMGGCTQIVTSDMNYVLGERGFLKKGISEEGGWWMYKNSDEDMIVATDVRMTTVERIYYGMSEYMPIK